MGAGVVAPGLGTVSCFRCRSGLPLGSGVAEPFVPLSPVGVVSSGDVVSVPVDGVQEGVGAGELWWEEFRPPTASLTVVPFPPLKLLPETSS
ncbi:hypothetical protein ACIQMP_00545 [Streptomyces sp. NPDC091385]|uniref:hypothetical protein n=1 Tax=Streptomyces sp. NPDC091385 TaxID=3365997 RepID=UPI00380D96F2